MWQAVVPIWTVCARPVASSAWEIQHQILLVVRQIPGHLNRLFATSLNFKVPTFVYIVPDHQPYAMGAMVLSWDAMFDYAFPPFWLLAPVLQKIAGEQRKIIVIAPTLSKPTCFIYLRSQFKSSVVHQSPNFLYLHPWLLSGVISHISRSARESTICVYDAKWSVLTVWCSEMEINTFNITTQQVVRGLASSTSKYYRSAISRKIALSGCVDFGKNGYISLLIQNVSLDRPRKKDYCSPVEIRLVPAYLPSASFEPVDKINWVLFSLSSCIW